MALGRGLPDDTDALAGEPGVGCDLQPPFIAGDEATRWLFSLNRFGIRPGLRRIEKLLSGLGDPQRSLRTLVVAGTNGKGTTTRLLAALLRQAGYSVGTFTSPHLLNVYERILIDDRPLPADRFARQIERIKPLVDEAGASWFESLTALATLFCQEEKVDFFCCETGLGGRLDATNALPAVATVLTTVAMDHERILGSTLSEIASEKLGLLKKDTPLFCGVSAELRTQVFEAAVRTGSPCHFLDELTRRETTADGWRLTLRDSVLSNLPATGSPPLQRNMALALLCVEELARRGVLRSPADPAAALRSVFLPGRWHRVLSDPDWRFDTAHNEQALAGTLDAFLQLPGSGRKFVVFGSMRDKQLPAALGRRLARCDGVVATPIGLPRSRNHDELTELMRMWRLDTGDPNLVASDIPRALAHLAGRLHNNDSVLVTGSCFLVAETLHHLGFTDLERTRQPVAAGPKLAPFRCVADSPRGGFDCQLES